MVKYFNNVDEIIDELKEAIESKRDIRIYPTWIQTPEGGFQSQNTLSIDVVHVRDIYEIIGDKTIDELREEIIEIQKECNVQSEVTSKLNQRYNVSQPEAHAMYRATHTNVPAKYKSLWEYKLLRKDWQVPKYYETPYKDEDHIIVRYIKRLILDGYTKLEISDLLRISTYCLNKYYYDKYPELKKVKRPNPNKK